MTVYKIDHDLIEQLCEHFDPATHPLLQDFKPRMSQGEWDILTAAYRLEVRARVEFGITRRAIADRLVELGVLTRETVDMHAHEHDLNYWIDKDEAYIQRHRQLEDIIDRFDNVVAAREIHDTVFRETARRILGHEVDAIPREVGLERWSEVSRVVEAEHPRVSENPLHDALCDFESLVDYSAKEGRIVDVAELLIALD